MFYRARKCFTYIPPSPGGSAETARAITAAATANPGDDIDATITTAATVTLSASFAAGQQCDIGNDSTSTANVTIAVPASSKLNGVTNGTQVVTPGSNYSVIADSPTSFRFK